MIFSKTDAQRIASGRKTLLLAAVTVDPLTGRAKPPVRYRLSEDFSVQTGSRGDDGRVPETCRPIVTGRTEIALGDLDYNDARALGYRTQVEMADDLLRRSDDSYPPREEVICHRCEGFAELTDEGKPATDGIDGDPCPDCQYGVIETEATLEDHEILSRFHARHGKTKAWAISFFVPEDPIRLLPEDSTKGYTTRTAEALNGEPEAVDEQTTERFAKNARAEFAAAKRREIETSGLQELRRLALDQGVDMRDFARARERRRLRDEEREAKRIRRLLEDKVRHSLEDKNRKAA